MSCPWSETIRAAMCIVTPRLIDTTWTLPVGGDGAAGIFAAGGGGAAVGGGGAATGGADGGAAGGATGGADGATVGDGEGGAEDSGGPDFLPSLRRNHSSIASPRVKER